MKRITVLITLIAVLVALPITVVALPISIDFSSVPAPPGFIDITNTQGNVPGDPVSFYYDNTPAGGFGTAQINLGGITGDTGILDPGPPPIEFNNTLAVDFTGAPIPEIMKLLVRFSLPGMTLDDSFGAMADFYYLGDFVNHVDVEVLQADPNGTIQNTCSFIFDYVIISFSTDAPTFQISEITYEPVPEPGTIILVAAGLLGLGGLRFARRKA